MDNQSMKEYFLLWSALRMWWDAEDADKLHGTLRFQTCAGRANHTQAFTRLAALCYLRVFWGDGLFCMQSVMRCRFVLVCPCKLNVFRISLSLSLRPDDICTGYLFLCDLRAEFWVLFQTFNASSSPNLYRCVLGEYLNKKRKIYVQVFLYICIIMNIYAFFVKISICMSSLVFLVFLQFYFLVDFVYNLFEVNKCNSWFSFCSCYILKVFCLWQYCEFKWTANMRLLYYVKKSKPLIFQNVKLEN